MSVRILSLIAVMMCVLSGCSTMNSNFGCNATASDSCLTIEQVDDMTRFADDAGPIRPAYDRIKAEHQLPKHQGRVVKQANGQSLWVAQKVEGQSWA